MKRKHKARVERVSASDQKVKKSPHPFSTLASLQPSKSACGDRHSRQLDCVICESGRALCPLDLAAHTCSARFSQKWNQRRFICVRRECVWGGTQHPSILSLVGAVWLSRRVFCSGATAWPRGLVAGGVLAASLPAAGATPSAQATDRPTNWTTLPSQHWPIQKILFQAQSKDFCLIVRAAFVLSRALFKQQSESLEHRREGTYTLQKESSPEGAANLAESPPRRPTRPKWHPSDGCGGGALSISRWLQHPMSTAFLIHARLYCRPQVHASAAPHVRSIFQQVAAALALYLLDCATHQRSFASPCAFVVSFFGEPAFRCSISLGVWGVQQSHIYMNFSKVGIWGSGHDVYIWRTRHKYAI